LQRGLTSPQLVVSLSGTRKPLQFDQQFLLNRRCNRPPISTCLEARAEHGFEFRALGLVTAAAGVASRRSMLIHQ